MILIVLKVLYCVTHCLITTRRLTLKQERYPVFLLTMGEHPQSLATPTYPLYKDPRCTTVLQNASVILCSHVLYSVQCTI